MFQSMIDAAFPALNQPEGDYMQCEDCEGTGIDPGALGPHDNAPCHGCDGTGAEPDLLKDLTIEERLVASIAVINYRRRNTEAA